MSTSPSSWVALRTAIQTFHSCPSHTEVLASILDIVIESFWDSDMGDEIMYLASVASPHADEPGLMSYANVAHELRRVLATWPTEESLTWHNPPSPPGR